MPKVEITWDVGSDRDEGLADALAHYAMWLLDAYSPSVSADLGANSGSDQEEED